MIDPQLGEFAIETLGLTKQFGSSLAVKNLRLSIPRSCAFGLFGPTAPAKARPSAC